MADHIDADMPPTLSAIFRRRESALQDDIQRATNTTLYRKSIVDTFYPPDELLSPTTPIVVLGIRKPGVCAPPAPPPRMSSLKSVSSVEHETMDDLPPPPPELLDHDELPPSESHYHENSHQDTDLPVYPQELVSPTASNEVLGICQTGASALPAPLPNMSLTSMSSLEQETVDNLPPPPAEMLDHDDLPPPPTTDSELDGDQLYINEGYYYGSPPEDAVTVANSLYEVCSPKTTPSARNITTLPPALARRRPKPNKPKKGVVAELQEEGKNAIDSPGSPTAPDLPPQDYILEEFEERSMIEPHSYDDPRLRDLINVLIEWINDELANQRIIVKDIEEDLFDGQILQKLLEKLSGVKLDVVEVTQSEELQKQKLQTVLDAVNKVLGLPRWNQNKWSVENIHSKNVVSIIHLLVALVRHFRAPIRLPENVSVNVVIVQKKDGRLQTRTVAEELTSTYDDLGMRVERDAFDTLFDHAPDKLQVVKQSLVSFVNKHLNRINLEVNDLDNQFHDGVYLTLMMGLLEGYFVPLYSFHLTPTSFEQKVANVALAFELMMEAGLGKPKARPEDLVNLDLKSTLRVLYNLFTKYKGIV